MSEVVRFTVPLPPVSLRANSRSHWTAKKRDADAYSFEVFQGMQLTAQGDDGLVLAWIQHKVFPWAEARVTYRWHYAGAKPDLSNLGGNTKYVQDIICVAPKLSPKQAEKYKRWHLGLVENDREIEPVYELVKVPKRDQERLEIEVVKL